MTYQLLTADHLPVRIGETPLTIAPDIITWGARAFILVRDDSGLPVLIDGNKWSYAEANSIWSADAS